jgi:hypothetical protein
MNRRIRCCAPAIAFGFVVLSQVQATTPACAPLVDALRLSYSVPYHQLISQLESGERSQSELLFDGKSLFMKIHGDWFDAGAMDNPFKEVATAGLQATSCSKQGEEKVANQVATVYQISQVIDGKASQSQIWISVTGLVLRMRDKTHDDFDMTVDYTNIKAPSGAKRIGS